MADTYLDDELAGRGLQSRFWRHVASVGITAKGATYALNRTPYAGLTSFATDCTSTGLTMLTRLAAPAPFSMIRVLIPNFAAAPVTGVKVGYSLCKASEGISGNPSANGSTSQSSTVNPLTNNEVPHVTGPSFAPVSGNLNFLRATFGGGLRIETDLPAALQYGKQVDEFTPIPVASYTATDWMPCTSVARTDGGTLPLVDIMVQYPPAGTAPASGAVSSSPGVPFSDGQFANWELDGGLSSTPSSRRFNQGRLWKCWTRNEMALETGNTLWEAGAQQAPRMRSSVQPIIVQFYCQDDVIHQLVYLNDSIGEYTDGGSVQEYGNNYAFRGLLAAAAATGKKVSYCPLTVPGGSFPFFAKPLSQLIDFIRPEIIMGKAVGPNDIGDNANANEATVRSARANLGYLMRLADLHGSRLVVEPMLAVGGTNRGAADSFRKTINNELRDQAAARGYTFCNVDATYTNNDATITSGQVQPVSGNSYDTTHVSEQGHAALAPTVQATLTSLLTAAP